MSSKKMAVFGIYATAAQAERAVDALMAAGFSNSDISVLLPDTDGARMRSPIRRTPRRLKAPPSA